MPLTAANIQRRYSLPLLTAQARRIGLPLALAKTLVLLLSFLSREAPRVRVRAGDGSFVKDT
jgi:hypothetical protein